MLCVLALSQKNWFVDSFSFFSSANSLHLQMNSDYTDFCSCNEFYYFMTHSTFSVISWVCWDLGFCVVVVTVLFLVARKVIGNPYQVGLFGIRAKANLRRLIFFKLLEHFRIAGLEL